MGSWTVILGALLVGQSLGEVAQRERERRADNAAAGLEAPLYSGDGAGIVASEPPERSPADVAEVADEDAGGEEWRSPLAEARERGAMLEPMLAEVSRDADRVDRLYETYMERCYGRYAVGTAPPGIGIPATPPPPVHAGTGRDWFVILETPSRFTTPVGGGEAGSIVLVETPWCEALREDLVATAASVKEAMRDLLELARRERILPGVVRELREKYRLEWPGWER